MHLLFDGGHDIEGLSDSSLDGTARTGGLDRAERPHQRAQAPHTSHLVLAGAVKVRWIRRKTRLSLHGSTC